MDERRSEHPFPVRTRTLRDTIVVKMGTKEILLIFDGLFGVLIDVLHVKLLQDSLLILAVEDVLDVLEREEPIRFADYAMGSKLEGFKLIVLVSLVLLFIRIFVNELRFRQVVFSRSFYAPTFYLPSLDISFCDN